MNSLKPSKKLSVLGLLCEGSSIRSTERLTGVHRDTIMRLLVSAGDKCSEFLDKRLVNVSCRKIEIDELWTFVGQKANPSLDLEKRLKSWGPQYTFLSMDPDSKLILNFLVGARSSKNCYDFIMDLSSRLANRVQLTTDGWNAYPQAIDDGFGGNVDYGQSIKQFHKSDPEIRYSPGPLKGMIRTVIQGSPVREMISTSHVERVNLTMRTFIKRFNRLTCAFSRKFENLRASVALHLAHYNWVKIHRSLKVTPAVASGIEPSLWDNERLFSAVGVL